MLVWMIKNKGKIRALNGISAINFDYCQWALNTDVFSSVQKKKSLVLDFKIIKFVFLLNQLVNLKIMKPFFICHYFRNSKIFAPIHDLPIYVCLDQIHYLNLNHVQWSLIDHIYLKINAQHWSKYTNSTTFVWSKKKQLTII